MREVRHALGWSKLVAAVLVGIAALSLGGAARAAGSGDAVAFQIDVAHDGVQADPGLQLPFGQRWTANFAGYVSYPLVAEGKVFVTVSDFPTGTILYALDPADGRALWSQPISGLYGWSAAAYDSGRLFVVNYSGVVSAFSAGDGMPLWSSQLPGQSSFSAPPTADGGVVYVGGSGSGGTLYAVDESDGHLIARQQVPTGENSSPTLSDSEVFVSYYCNQTYAFARGTLAPLWHYNGPCQGPFGWTSVYTPGRLFTSDSHGNLTFDPVTGSPLAPWAPPGDSMQPVIEGSTAWGLAAVPPISGRSLAARNTSNGEMLWSFAGDGQLFGTSILIDNGANRFLVVLSQSGNLYAVDAASGAVLWSTTGPAWSVSGIRPAWGLGAGDGLLLVPVGNQLTAYATDTTAPTLTVPDHVAVSASSANGATVSFSVSASDPDNPASASCLPASGSLFPIGTTIVSCIATDTNGLTSRASFPVAVSASNAVCDLSRYPLQKGALVLKNANLSGCYLAHTNLSNATATNANASGAYLVSATLTGANLSQANFTGALLSDANLTGANLALSTLRGAKLDGATLTGVTWSGTTCPDGTNSNGNGGTCIAHLG